MNSIANILAILAFGCLPIIAAEPSADADKNTKEFSKYLCRYTLPGPEWEWIDLKDPSIVFAARDDTGFVVVLNVTTIAPHITMTKEFLSGIDKGATKSGQIEKRGSRSLTFKGLPCYQLEMVLAKQNKTAATRIFLANGFSYSLQLLGTNAPAEKSAIFPIAMNGFEFTKKSKPPVARSSSSPEKNDAEAAGEKVGQALGYLLLVGVVVYLVQRDSAKKKSA